MIQDASTRLKLDPATTAAALGTMVMGLRMGIDPKTWDEMRKTVPDMATMLSQAPKGGGRTAEMIALTAPGATRKTLETAIGLTAAQVDGLAETLRAALRTHLPAETAEKAVAALNRSVG
jgi:hypothetical protein